MRNIRLTVSYDGTRYFGFQAQPQKNTIQDKLEEAIAVLTGERGRLISSGRTDAGVHARGQVVNFHTASSIPGHRWAMALNTRLPEDIIVTCSEEVDPAFHASYQAERKTYRYTINIGKYRDVFRQPFQFHHPTKLDLTAMEKALNCLVGEHDFSSFCSRKSTKTSHVRTLFEARMEKEAPPEHATAADHPGVVHFFFSGSGFLYNMVRIIMGTLIQIGEGKKDWRDMRSILEGRDRSLAGPTAEARGLMLWEVKYEFVLDS